MSQKPLNGAVEESTFLTLYNKLNTMQKAAVDTVEGPVMVIAGPGTGKTTILALRIANILKKTDTAPENILALTFTESGVISMRKKLTDIIGPTAYKVNVYTFHSFATDNIKRHGEYFPRIVSSEPATEEDQISIMEEVIVHGQYTLLRPFGDQLKHVRTVLSSISEMKREKVIPVELEKIIQKQEERLRTAPDLIHEKGAYKGKVKKEYRDLEKEIQKQRELLTAYKAYEEGLSFRKLYDFDDMLLDFIKALQEHDNLLLDLQETYQYILADEHQDANKAQNTILELLANFHDEPNLFIVGDEKQAIYRFQGASLENFLYFTRLYPNAKIIALTDNYRSTQTILDAATSLIDRNILPEKSDAIHAHLRAKLQAESVHASNDVQVKVAGFSSESHERFFLAKTIREKLDGGTKPEEIAVIYRENNEALYIAAALESLDIPYAIQSEDNVLKNILIQDIISYLRALVNPYDNTILSKALLSRVNDMPTMDILKMLTQLETRRAPLIEHIQSTLPDVYKQIEKLTSLSREMNVTEWFGEFLSVTDLPKRITQSKSGLEDIELISLFFDQIKKFQSRNHEARLSDFVTHLDFMQRHNIRIKKNGTMTEGKVSLLTAHRSKGMEFEYVFISGVIEGRWSNKASRSFFHIPLFEDIETEFEKIDDERRLLYVALTRARKEVWILYGGSNNEGRLLLPSQFLHEISSDHLSQINTEAFETSLVEYPENKLPKASNKKILDLDYIRELFIKQGLSVTALNNYLRCPSDYFWQNLIRIPSLQNRNQMYGTAVHNTLDLFFRSIKQNEEIHEDVLIRMYYDALEKLPLTQHDIAELRVRGEQSLSGFFKTNESAWKEAKKNGLLQLYISEMNVSGVSVHLPKQNLNIPLKGKLDLVMPLEVGSKNVVVVDYKTKQPMTRNEIEGNTKNSDGAYKRQLVFYDLLLDKQQEFKMKFGELSFIEPDDQKRYKTERFEITDNERDLLEQDIIRVSEEIISGEFLTKMCQKKDCNSCKWLLSLKDTI